LAGLIDLGEVPYISYSLGGAAEARSVGSQVREDGGQGFISDSWDGEKIFTWEGVLGFLGRENLFNLSFQLFNRGGEGFDMPQQDPERCGPGFFGSA